MYESSVLPIVKRPVDKNILIVEDDEDTAESLWITLLMEGYGVRVSKNRDFALEQLDQNLYHIILMDYWMDGKSAMEFIQEAKRLSPLSKIVLMTAASRAQDTAKALGLKHWIGKPVEPELLIKVLNDRF